MIKRSPKSLSRQVGVTADTRPTTTCSAPRARSAEGTSARCAARVAVPNHASVQIMAVRPKRLPMRPRTIARVLVNFDAVTGDLPRGSNPFKWCRLRANREQENGGAESEWHRIRRCLTHPSWRRTVVRAGPRARTELGFGALGRLAHYGRESRGFYELAGRTTPSLAIRVSNVVGFRPSRSAAPP